MPRLVLPVPLFLASLLSLAGTAHASVYTTLEAADWGVSAASSGSATALSPAAAPSNSLTFTYTNNGGVGVSSVASNDSYTIETVAPTTGAVTLDWNSSGFYAYAGVTASLAAFSGSTTQTLYSYGPQSCCTTPSNGFGYSGAVTLDAIAGQMIGFTVAGANGDSNTLISGTLVVSQPAPIDEPHTGLLLAPALFGLALVRWRSA
ncbi:MAG: hypothetical protein HIU82_09110 [Proteobacteria bacterium]|nr:hypothetical protein [Pseudomonadota bacterium]